MTVADKKSNSFVSVLRLVAIILAVLVIGITAITNLVLVYIVFAPDDFPKPFYLQYYNAGETPVANVQPQQQVVQPQVQEQVPQTTNNNSQTTTNNQNSNTDQGSMSPTWQISPGQGLILDTGSKIVNLNEQGGRKLIRTNVVLEFAPNNPQYFTLSEEEKTAYMTSFKEELTGKLAVINDAIITLLSTKDFAAVYTSEGKEALRNEIMDSVNNRLHEYRVIYVYFTEFVMQ